MRELIIRQLTFQEWMDLDRNADILSKLGPDECQREYQRQLSIDKATIIDFIQALRGPFDHMEETIQ